jgi:hypothetical protein
MTLSQSPIGSNRATQHRVLIGSIRATTSTSLDISPVRSADA